MKMLRFVARPVYYAFLILLIHSDYLGAFGQNEEKAHFQLIQTLPAIAMMPQKVITGDLDQDGDPDLISVSSQDGKVAWYENKDGKGHFGAQNIIHKYQLDKTTKPKQTDTIYDKFGRANSVYTIDIDGDQDLDVLSLSPYFHEVNWHENRMKVSNNWETHLITDVENQPVRVYAEDIDKDQDMDVIIASDENPMLVWYEQTDSNPITWVAHPISSPPKESQKSDRKPRCVKVADMDGDSDTDIVLGFIQRPSIVWYENPDDKTISWKKHPIPSRFTQARSLCCIDFDRDGDTDIVTACRENNILSWYENKSEGSRQWTEHQISIHVDWVHEIQVADIDNDNDFDVLVASSGNHQVVWFENKGNSSIKWVRHLISDSILTVMSLITSDFDMDGDLDVVVASWTSHFIAWFQNRLIHNVPVPWYRNAIVLSLIGFFVVIIVLLIIFHIYNYKRRGHIIAARTASLTQANQELINYQKELQSVAYELSVTEEQERRKLAKDLHDRIGHGLAACKMMVLNAKKNLLIPQSNTLLNEIHTLLDQIIKDTRTLTFEVSPPMLYELGLEPTVQWLAEKFQQNYFIPIQIYDDEANKPINDDIRALSLIHI